MRRDLRAVLVAGEASGDQLGAMLAARLGRSVVGGVVGPRMRAVGVPELAGVEALSLVGLDPSGALRALRLLGELRRSVDMLRPTVVITIDAPSFTLRLARKLTVPVLHWVSPQVWAWRPGRVRRIARTVDGLACLLPFEAGWYPNLDARFTGHPLAGADPVALGPAVGLAAGSRPAERERLGPIFREALAGLPVVEAVPPGGRPVVPSAKRVTGVAALAGKVRAVLVCSGTATLELAVRGIPMVSAYAPDLLTRTVARRLLRVDTLCLPNLILGQKVVPELVERPRPADLRRALDGVLDQPRVQREAFRELRPMLRPEGAVERVARWARELGGIAAGSTRSVAIPDGGDRRRG